MRFSLDVFLIFCGIVFLIAVALMEAREKHKVIRAPPPEAKPTVEPTHYILVQSWAVYVKEASFFRDQGGLTEPWGRTWKPVVAESIEAARAIGERMRSGQHAEE